MRAASGIHPYPLPGMVPGAARRRTAHMEVIAMSVATEFYSATAFYDAWLRGVSLAGPQFFGDGTGVGATKDDYAPDFDMVQGGLGYLSSGEAAFLVALYSFYNPSTGAKWAAEMGCGSPGELAARMDESRRRVIADLLIAYNGW